jgi:hypothetical protein
MRNARPLSFVLGLLTAYVAAPVAVLAVSAAIVACDDENDPKTWVKRLDDQAQRGKAIDRLKHFFDDNMSKTGNKTDSPEVKELLDAMVEPLAKTYVAGGLDDKTRIDLIKLLADTRDPRMQPALAKALKDFEPGKTDDDARAACEAINSMSKAGVKFEQGTIDELWNVFSRFRPSKAKSERLLHAVHDAVVTVHDPSYGDKAADKLKAAAAADVDSKMDQIQWWQLTSIQVISELKYTKAIKPLILVLLTPSKQDLNATTRTCLLKMAPAAEPELVKAIKGEDPDYVAAGAAYKDKANLAIIADTLALISRPAGRDAIVAALATADTDTTLTGLAQALVQFPEIPTIEPAFQAAYAKLKWTASVELLGDLNPKAALAQASANFYDPALTDWLAKEVASAPDSTSKILPLEAAIKVMPADKKGVVGAALDKAKGSLGDDLYGSYKSMFDLSSQALDKCKDNVGCYVTMLDEPIPSSPPTAYYKAVKATCMAVAYSTNESAWAGTRADLVKRVDKLKVAGARLAIVQAIDELAPKGDTAAADALDKIVASDTKTGDRNLLLGDDAVVKIALRLRARAAP